MRIAKEINRGRESIVYDIVNQPTLVAKVNRYSSFRPRELSFKNCDPNKHIIAATDDFEVAIMQKIKGEPLYGRNWISKMQLTLEEYFSQIEKIKSIPDKAFINYYKELLGLRKRGYDLDSVNPNNILGSLNCLL